MQTHSFDEVGEHRIYIFFTSFSAIVTQGQTRKRHVVGIIYVKKV